MDSASNKVQLMMNCINNYDHIDFYGKGHHFNSNSSPQML